MIRFTQTPDKDSAVTHTETTITLWHNEPTLDDMKKMLIRFLSAIGFEQEMVRKEILKDNWCDECEYKPIAESTELELGELEWPDDDDPIYVDNQDSITSENALYKYSIGTHEDNDNTPSDVEPYP